MSEYIDTDAARQTINSIKRRLTHRCSKCNHEDVIDGEKEYLIENLFATLNEIDKLKKENKAAVKVKDHFIHDIEQHTKEACFEGGWNYIRDCGYSDFTRNGFEQAIYSAEVTE